jgi:hypothetical protein
MVATAASAEVRVAGRGDGSAVGAGRLGQGGKGPAAERGEKRGGKRVPLTVAVKSTKTQGNQLENITLTYT